MYEFIWNCNANAQIITKCSSFSMRIPLIPALVAVQFYCINLNRYFMYIRDELTYIELRLVTVKLWTPIHWWCWRPFLFAASLLREPKRAPKHKINVPQGIKKNEVVVIGASLIDSYGISIEKKNCQNFKLQTHLHAKTAFAFQSAWILFAFSMVCTTFFSSHNWLYKLKVIFIEMKSLLIEFLSYSRVVAHKSLWLSLCTDVWIWSIQTEMPFILFSHCCNWTRFHLNRIKFLSNFYLINLFILYHFCS